jgi:hypothetical protein
VNGDHRLSASDFKLVIGAKNYKVKSAYFRVVIETPSPNGGSFANPIERFEHLRVHHSMTLELNQSKANMGDLERRPCVELFEPLSKLNPKHYLLPWEISDGSTLKESNEWGGWVAASAHNEPMENTKLVFSKATHKNIFLKWSAQLPNGKFVFEGPVKIEPVTMYGISSLDYKSVLETLYGKEVLTKIRVKSQRIKNSQIENWSMFTISQK